MRNSRHAQQFERDPPPGVVKREPDKILGLAVKAGVFLADQADDFGEVEVLHLIELIS